MYPSLVDCSQFRATRAGTLARSAGLVLLLLIEVMLLSLRFDTGTLAHDGRWWSDWLHQVPSILRLAFVVGIATLALGGAQWRQALREIAEQGEWSRQSWLYLLGHLASFAGFTVMAVSILEGDLGTRSYPSLWVIGWALLGLVALALWGAVAWMAGPAGSLWSRGWSGALMGGLVLGMTAWGAGGATSAPVATARPRHILADACASWSGLSEGHLPAGRGGYWNADLCCADRS